MANWKGFGRKQTWPILEVVSSLFLCEFLKFLLGCLVTEANAGCSFYPQLLVSLVAALSLVASGMSLGFPAISLHQLRDEGLSDDDASWFGEKKSIVT
jgi:hypothetical protein